MADADGQEQMFSGANVAKLEDGDILASLSAWARVLDTDRETLRRLLLAANVTSKGERAGNAVYGGRDVFNAWLSGSEERVDPESMTPFKRRAWYQGEHEKLKLQMERGELVPAIEVEQTMGKLAKIFVLGMDTSIDTIERDVGLNPMQAEKLEQHFDRLREQLYQSLAGEIASDEPAPAAKKAPKELPPQPAGSALEEGVQFLRLALADGPRPTGELVTAAKEAHISEGTLRRAKASLGDEIVAKRQGKGWVWSMSLKSRKT